MSDDIPLPFELPAVARKKVSAGFAIGSGQPGVRVNALGSAVVTSGVGAEATIATLIGKDRSPPF
jgi:hypothetical protein